MNHSYCEMYVFFFKLHFEFMFFLRKFAASNSHTEGGIVGIPAGTDIGFQAVRQKTV